MKFVLFSGDLVPELFKTAQRVGAIYGDVWFWDGFSGGDGEVIFDQRITKIDGL